MISDNSMSQRTLIFRKIIDEIKKKNAGRALVVGISGIDCSGKTNFARNFEKFLLHEGCKTQTIHLDDFHNPKQVRYAGESPIDDYYNRSFNIREIIGRLLQPIHNGQNISEYITLLDINSDSFSVNRKYEIDRSTIVIFEGVFLFRNELAEYMDYKVFLDIPFDESFNRAARRDGAELLRKYGSKYHPTQKRYLKEFPPDKTADIVVDNMDWNKPAIIQ